MKVIKKIILLSILPSSFIQADVIDNQNKELMRSLKYNEVKEDVNNSRERYLLNKWGGGYYSR